MTVSDIGCIWRGVGRQAERRLHQFQQPQAPVSHYVTLTPEPAGWQINRNRLGNWIIPPNRVIQNHGTAVGTGLMSGATEPVARTGERRLVGVRRWSTNDEGESIHHCERGDFTGPQHGV
jgi:hypothetical protein